MTSTEITHPWLVLKATPLEAGVKASALDTTQAATKRMLDLTMVAMFCILFVIRYESNR